MINNAINNAVSNISNDPAIGFILLALIAAFIICIAAIPKVMKECNIPEEDNLEAFKRFFRIEEGEVERLDGTREKFFYVSIIKTNMIIYKTWDFLKEEFSSKEEAEKFLFSNKHISFRNSMYSILMVYRLRLLNQITAKNAIA